jgi:Zn finger protein HypA/HybF involved in hydrogenase expression
MRYLEWVKCLNCNRMYRFKLSDILCCPYCGREVEEVTQERVREIESTRLRKQVLGKQGSDTERT